MVVVFVEVGVGASVGHRCEGSEPADCAILYRSRDALSDDMIGEVCVRNSRSCLRNKVSCIFSGETLTIRYDVICTVVLVADVNRQLICFLSPACHHRLPRCIYVGYGRYLFVDIVPCAPTDLGITSKTIVWAVGLGRVSDFVPPVFCFP